MARIWQFDSRLKISQRIGGGFAAVLALLLLLAADGWHGLNEARDTSGAYRHEVGDTTQNMQIPAELRAFTADFVSAAIEGGDRMVIAMATR